MLIFLNNKTIILITVILMSFSIIIESSTNSKSNPLISLGAEYLNDDEVILQKSGNDCGPSVLKMIFNFYKIDISLEKIKKRILKKNGTNMLDIKRMAEKSGLKVFAYKMGMQDLKKVKNPAILYLKKKHFVVLEKITNDRLIVLDPGKGRLAIKFERFLTIWSGKILIFKKTTCNDLE